METAAYIELIDTRGIESACRRTRDDEFGDILGLLLDHAARRDESTRHLAGLVARACLGENHLWQDLGLPSRQILSALMREHFPALYAKNTGNMRWKKFFYRQLCERAAVLICKSPSCGVCCDYAECFGPEEGMAGLRPGGEVKTGRGTGTPHPSTQAA